DLLLAQAAHWRLEDSSDKRLEHLLSGLFPNKDQDARVWWRVVHAVRPGESIEKTLKQIEDLLEGRATVLQVQSYLAGPGLAKVRSSVSETEKDRSRGPDPDLSLASAGAYHAMGRDDLADAVLVAVDRSKCSQEELIRLADLAAARKDWATAQRDYDAA